MMPIWVKSLTADSEIRGIAINPETKWIIAHSANASPNIIVILDPSGNLKGAYTYGNIPMEYEMMMRNLLLGYESTNSTYTVLIQNKLPSNNGFKLFCFTFSSSISDPSLLWGFNSD
jgi:hypothetical protein